MSADGHLIASRETASSQPVASLGMTEIPQIGRLTTEPGITVGVILLYGILHMVPAHFHDVDGDLSAHNVGKVWIV